MKAIRELQYITSLSKEYEMYERREKYMRDTLYLKNQLIRKYEKGKFEGKLETAKNLIKLGIDYEN